MKIGVIGAGRWGRNLVKTFAELGVLHAVCEANPELGAAAKAAHPDITLYQDHQQLLTSDVDAIAIATPVATHFALAKAVLLSGKDVFVEKPLAMTTAESDELVKLTQQTGRILMVGHMLLYQPAIQFIKEYIASGKLGKITSLRQVRRNLGTIRTHENALYSLGVHDLAVLSFLVGEPPRGLQAAGQAVINAGIEGDVSLHIQYPSGIHAHLHVCWLWPVKDRHLMILGSRGALLFDELKQTVTLHESHGNADATVTQGEAKEIFSNSDAPLKLELQHFLDCLATRKQPLSPVEQGRDVVALMEQAMQQIKERECVDA